MTLAVAFAPPGSNRDQLLCPAIHPAPPPAAALEQPMPAPVASEPIVLKRLVVERGTFIKMQMRSKRPIVSVEIDREGVIHVEPAPDDPTTIFVTGMAPGIVRLTLRDDRGGVEKRQMGMPK
jgi:hypothetical protein